MTNKPQLQALFESHTVDDDILSTFSKSSAPILTLESIKSKIYSKRTADTELFTDILFMLISTFAITGVYSGILNLLGLFSINTILSLVFGASCLGVLFASVHLVGKFMSYKKPFSWLKEPENAKKLFELFLHSNTDSILQEIKSNLSNRLESLNIQEVNPSVFNYLNDSIHRLDGDFNKLKYEVENCSKINKYSFQSFRTFFFLVDTIDENISEAKNIKIINT